MAVLALHGGAGLLRLHRPLLLAAAGARDAGEKNNERAWTTSVFACGKLNTEARWVVCTLSESEMSKRIPLFQPAPAKKSPKWGLVQTTWEKEATRLGPLTVGSYGTMGSCFDEKYDLSLLPSASEIKDRQLRDIYTTLKPGSLVALKRGYKVIAYVEIVRDYYYCPDQTFGWHSYDFVVRSLPTTETIVRVRQTFAREGAARPAAA